MDAVGFVLGALGTALGLMSTWYLVQDNRVRLRVRVSRCRLISPLMNEPRICAEVVNLGKFAVTITGIGFELRDGSHSIVPSPEILDGGGWPRRVEPRTALSLFMPESDDNRANLKLVVRPWARTACGVIRHGSKRCGREIRDWAVGRSAGSDVASGARGTSA